MKPILYPLLLSSHRFCGSVGGGFRCLVTNVLVSECCCWHNIDGGDKDGGTVACMLTM